MTTTVLLFQCQHAAQLLTLTQRYDKQTKVGQRTSNGTSVCDALVGRHAQHRLRYGHFYYFYDCSRC